MKRAHDIQWSLLPTAVAEVLLKLFVWPLVVNTQSSDAEGPWAPDWGPRVEGFSVRLTAKGRVWDFQEPHFFRFGVRNWGEETLSVARSQASGELELDGVWCHWLLPVLETPVPLLPRDKFLEREVTLNCFGKDSGLVSLSPGNHTLRFAVFAQKPNGTTVRAVSNPLEVECRWATNDPPPPRSVTAPELPTAANLTGHVVDDNTGAPITRFWVQEGFMTAAKLGAIPWNPTYQIAWNSTFHGPVLSGPLQGGFSVQIRKPGQVWRLLAEGYQPEVLAKHSLVAPVEPQDRVVRLRRGGELRGVVLDHAGHPVVGAKVFLATEQTPQLTDGQPQATFMGSRATTDGAGRFALRGVGGTEPKLLVVSPEGLKAWAAPKYRPGREARIVLPQPGTLVVRYDIAGDEPEAKLSLVLRSAEREGSDRMEWKPKVANGGQLTLTNLPLGMYEFSRLKTLRLGEVWQICPCERRTVVLEAGQTQRVGLVRPTGHSVQGLVAGLEHTKVSGGIIYIRSAGPANAPGYEMLSLRRCFDALTFGQNGYFQTARLEPGTYTLTVEAYGPEPEESEHNPGIRYPDFVAATNVTVRAQAPPPLLGLELKPRTNARREALTDSSKEGSKSVLAPPGKGM